MKKPSKEEVMPVEAVEDVPQLVEEMREIRERLIQGFKRESKKEAELAEVKAVLTAQASDGSLPGRLSPAQLRVLVDSF